ncbi:MAG: hypothetical protein MUO59_03630 [Actinobacteria bacterium]|nr:hypothetical protein [Actinomycetota bacterium]
MIAPSKNNTVNTLKHWYSFRLKLIFEGILIGSVTGLIVVFFRLAIKRIEETTMGITSFFETRLWLYPVFFIVLILIGLLIGVLIKKEPLIRGSGIPQIEGLLGIRPIYESLMERSLENKEYKGFTGDRKVKVVIEIHVCIDSRIENKKIMEIDWPDNCLLIGVKRAGQELIPKGNTLIYPGDTLIIITNEDRAHNVQHLLKEITGIDEIEAHYQYEIDIMRFLKKIIRIFRSRRRDQGRLLKIITGILFDHPEL